jgi:hypothetical protein
LASVPGTRNMEEARNVPAAGGSGRVGLAILWVLAILIFGVGDVVTTAAALGLGGAEGNVIAAALIHASGGNVWGLTLVKGIVLSGLLLLSYLRLGKHAWTVPAVLTCAGTYMLLYNIATLMLLV